MSVEQYRRAIETLEAHGGIDLRFPTGDATIAALEERLAVTLPGDYRQMLRDFGILMFEGQMVYGVGRAGIDAKGGSGVVFQTEAARARDQITPSMVRILSSGYGPEFVIECAEMSPDGEAPVYEVPVAGYRDGVTLVAPSFGAFLLAEVGRVLA